jgi:hypothetical protein
MWLFAPVVFAPVRAIRRLAKRRRQEVVYQMWVGGLSFRTHSAALRAGSDAESRLTMRSGFPLCTCLANFAHSHPQALALRLGLGASPRRVAETSVRTGARLEAAAPVAVYCGGPMPCRRRLNIHRQCPKIGMQKAAYPTDCIPVGAHSLWTVPSPSPALLAQGQSLRLPHTYLLGPIGWQPQSAPASSCRRQWRQPSLAGERGGLGMVFPPAKHVPHFRGNDMLQIQL